MTILKLIISSAPILMNCPFHWFSNIKIIIYNLPIMYTSSWQPRIGKKVYLHSTVYIIGKTCNMYDVRFFQVINYFFKIGRHNTFETWKNWKIRKFWESFYYIYNLHSTYYIQLNTGSNSLLLISNWLRRVDQSERRIEGTAFLQ